jgi:hypothetical protein
MKPGDDAGDPGERFLSSTGSLDEDCGSKICGACGARLPLSQFRRRWRGRPERQSSCNGCRNALRRIYNLRRRDDRVHRFAQSVVRDRLSAQALVREMIRRFGGLDGFAEAWMSAYHRAQDAGKPHLMA